MRVPGAKIPLPLGAPFPPPPPPQPLPDPSQRVGMGSPNQARWLPPDGPTRRQSGQALHPTGLRLVRQVSLDSRVPAVASGPLNNRGWGSGLGWKGWQVGF
jgi:hypothetical protein